ncbi:MAG: nucleotidyltransferase family protein [Caldilineaceae bacterium]|nr:nucleotidyltransferase family protein [Caldilineaceae bacterium]
MTNNRPRINHNSSRRQPDQETEERVSWASLLAPTLPSSHNGWAQVDLVWVTQQAIHHQLGPLLHHRLRAAQVSAPPEQDRQLQALARQATVKSLRREHTLRRILQAFNQAGIRPVILKGAALAYTVYPTPACRSMSDVDLWVAHDVMSRACATLESIGYQQKDKELRPPAFQAARDGEIQFRQQESEPRLIELHWGIFAGEWLHRVSRVDRAGIWQRLQTTEICGYPVYLLAPEDAVIHLAIHLAINHQMSLHTLRSLVDIGLLAQQGIDWAVVAQRARNWRLYHAVAFVLAVWDDIFHLPESQEAVQTMPISSWRRSLLQRFVDIEDILALPTLSSTPQRLLYLLSIVDHPGDALHLLRRTIWPEDQWLIARYGRSGWQARIGHMRGVFQGKP